MNETSKNHEGNQRPCRTFGELDLASQIGERKSAWPARGLAPLLSCTSGYLLKRAKAGKMPSYRIGGMVRFDPAITAAWLRARQVG